MILLDGRIPRWQALPGKVEVLAYARHRVIKLADMQSEDRAHRLRPLQRSHRSSRLHPPATHLRDRRSSLHPRCRQLHRLAGPLAHRFQGTCVSRLPSCLVGRIRRKTSVCHEARWQISRRESLPPPCTRWTAVGLCGLRRTPESVLTVEIPKSGNYRTSQATDASAVLCNVSAFNKQMHSMRSTRRRKSHSLRPSEYCIRVVGGSAQDFLRDANLKRELL